MTERDTNRTMVRLKSDVFVYKAGGDIIIMRRQLSAIRLQSQPLAEHIDDILGLLKKGAPWAEIGRAARVPDTQGITAALDALLRRGFLEVVRDSCQSLPLDELLPLGLFNETEVHQALLRLAVQVLAPPELWEALQVTFGQLGIRARHQAVGFDPDKVMRLSIPRDSERPNTFVILCLPCLDLPYVEQLAYRLAQEEVHYLPLYRETDDAVVVGPVVTKGGPCIQCLQDRIISNLEHPELAQMLVSPGTQLVRRGQDHFDPVQAQMVAALLAGMTVRYVTGLHRGDGLRRGFYHRVSNAGLVIQRIAVYRNPRCTACGPDLFEPSTTMFQNMPLPAEEQADAARE